MEWKNYDIWILFKISICSYVNSWLVICIYYSRKRKLLAYAQERGISIGDLKMQLDFLWQEMGDDFEAVLSALVASQSVREASDIVLMKYGSPPIKAPRFKKNGLLSHSGITTSTPPHRSPSTPSPSKT